MLLIVLTIVSLTSGKKIIISDSIDHSSFKDTTCDKLYPSGFTNLTNFGFCKKHSHNLNVVIFILSATEKFEARTTIRETWGWRSGTPILFVLGKTKNPSIAEKLLQEQTKHRDLIQGQFYDTYSNLTLKTISILEYVLKYCKRLVYIFKCDDDMFINVPRLLKLVSDNINGTSLIGQVKTHEKPFRKMDNKYYMSIDEYRPAIYPPFLHGASYLIPKKVVKTMFLNAKYGRCLWLEDVYVTGIITSVLGIRLVDNELLHAYIKNRYGRNLKSFISINVKSPSEMRNLFRNYRLKGLYRQKYSS